MPRKCDFAVATATMIRRDVHIKCGDMDESNFIYYNDIELGCRIKLSGYRVVSLGSVQVRHDSGMRKKTASTLV